jgi:hypothetical protein
MHKSAQAVEEARYSLTKALDAFWLRVLNEEMRLVMFLKLGVNGLAGICPLV